MPTKRIRGRGQRRAGSARRTMTATHTCLLPSGGLTRRRAPPGDEAHAVSFGVLGVHGPGGDAAGVARSILDPFVAEREGHRSVQHQQARVEPVSVRLAMDVGFDLALLDLVAFPNELGFELGSSHGVLHRGQAAVTPPSTGSATPVTNDASSERRNSAALAISSGRPVRPSGTEPWARLRTSSSGSIPAVDF